MGIEQDGRAPGREATRAAVAAFVGTTIEWYDFYIYGTAAALVFGKVFFPPQLAPSVATLLAFVTFWAGFVARPLGGIVFGHLGDRIGRKQALVVTLTMMGLATTGIGLLPSYAQIGIGAPVGLVVLRLVQGVAVGGEWGGAVLIATESAPRHRRILYAACAQQGAPAGNLLATGAFFALGALPLPGFLSWGWRIPFLLSAVLVVVGMLVRLKLEESADMRRVLASRNTAKLPIADVLRDYRALVLLAAGALPLIHVTYFRSTFALSWATSSLGYAQSTFLAMLALSLVVQFVMQPVGAWVVSRFDMRHAMAAILLPELVLMPAMFFALETRVIWLATLAMCLSTIPSAMFYGAVGGVLARAFPARVRYTGLSLAYQLCSLVVGGGTPVLAQAILGATGGITGVAVASGLYAVVSLACMLALLARTGHRGSEPSTAERADAELESRERESADASGQAGGQIELAGEARTWRPG
ncbi:MAG: Inner membrane metabolite transport protein YhjE [Burkholderia plantarii]|nr:MAG: Inner membrane metabolite transport protein YhjE [Burkholderia plantarii]